ncbi:MULTISPECIES: hypothetical protein [Pseudoalteromonas]|uniref:hypothetical protein n=1 Tax=Pseudoalteromonas TaxID=53246 RepID=UPI0002C8E2BD|nr:MULTISPECIES: hypothetical protein [Pseudoalteromonas]ENN99317.1 hypothetical protein J139_07967 [Pseudoalteromonas agarivorans S816]TMS65593.1 hypothetical protein CWB83_12750 [Pseudoalteromonas sp. S1691]TMS66375.1 hypothetical protein CWB86_17885 [Pseudoalteromonas sp. S1731]TMS73911.1 hypothetical protein CWB88_08800 [Pseudoalteromonas sp. S1941]TMS77141.1 hypothetical protein CWB82_12605 [Pseudoalteromonas sp. S1690]
MNYQADKYNKIRTAALLQTQDQFKEMEPKLAEHFCLTHISKEALDSQKTWGIPGNRQIGWEWDKVVQKYRRDYVARIELAIWYKKELCGLMIGKASDGKLVVKINFIQGGEKDNQLKGFVVPIATRYAELFAVAIEANWIGIQDPIENIDLITYYRELGFDEKDHFDPRNKALLKRVELNED